MSLSSALSIAQNSLLNTQRQTSVLSRNIANANNVDYARRSATLTSLAPGSRIALIQRATDAALFKQNLTALSGWTAQSAIVNGLDYLTLQVNGVDQASSPAMLVGKLQDALQLYSATPSNRSLGENAVEMARDLARALNTGSASIQSFRSDMDKQIASGVADLNTLLADFKKVNDEIVVATTAGREALDAMDQRDAILKKIAEFVPISTVTRENNDTMIVTADGAMLFETEPRTVTFDATPVYGPGVEGNRVLVDGVPISRSTGANTSGGGSLAAMTQLRDVYAVEMQTQLDEVARGLVEAFSETDPNPPNDQVPGLFTWTGSPAMPATGTVQVGLSANISINALVDPTQGGDVELLRDGISFDYNTNDYDSFNDRLIGFVNAIDAPIDLVSAGGMVENQSLKTYTTAAVSWVEDARKLAASAAETKSATMFRSAEALSNITNVNVDEEMALMLELEQSYGASAKMLQMLDEMLKTLLSVVR